MDRSSSILEGQKLLPIIHSENVDTGVSMAKAMANAGAVIVEVVLRSEASLEIVTQIKDQLPHVKVSAGTIIDHFSLESAIKAGADFLVTPGVSVQLLEHLKSCPIPVLPGVSNVSDIIMARDYGYKELKLFPASLAGGVNFLKSIESVFRDISFCPTGGVNQENRDEFLALSNVFAVGGTWVAPNAFVEAKDWNKITALCQAALD